MVKRPSCLCSHSFSLSLDPLPHFPFSLSLPKHHPTRCRLHGDSYGALWQGHLHQLDKVISRRMRQENRKQNKMSHFNTKIKRVANKQKMRREVNEGFGFGAEICQGRWRKMVVNNRRVGKGDGCVNKQTAQ